MLRYWYALKQGWLNRRYLKLFLTDPTRRVSHVREITPERLDNAHIAILVLDFDGVLGCHGDKMPLPEVSAWLKSLALVVGEQRLALFTNKPNPERLRYFKQHFPSLYIVHDVPKKPYPAGLQQVADFKGVDIHRIALLDDRLLTGMLATCLAYSQGFYFTKPYRAFSRHPLVEGFFSLLRATERCLIGCVKG